MTPGRLEILLPSEAIARDAFVEARGGLYIVSFSISRGTIRFPLEAQGTKKGGITGGMSGPPKHLLRTYLLFPVIVILGPLGNVLLSKGMKEVGASVKWAPTDLWPILIRIFTSGYVLSGIASLVTFYFIYMLMLTWADYSYVQPASALSYAVVSLLGYLWLGEVVPPLRWVGIGIICAGVLVIVGTPHRTTHGANLAETEKA